MKHKLAIPFLALLLVFLPLTRVVNAQTPTTVVETLSVTPLISEQRDGPSETATGSLQEGIAKPKTAKIKEQITKRIANKKSRVKIKMSTGQELKGRLDQAGDEQFTLKEDKSGRSTQIAYRDVDKVSGRGMTNVTKVLIIVGVAVVVVAIIGVVAVKNIDPFENGLFR
jgi:hypothetical protein